MNVKIISIEKPEINKHEYKVDFALNNEPKTATLIEPTNEKDEYKVVFYEEIKIGELEGFLKEMIVLTFKESKGE